MATCTQRETTRLEHRWEIARDLGYRDFVDGRPSLPSGRRPRMDDGRGPVAVFSGAVGWLLEREVLLPGVTTLARLVARERDAARLDRARAAGELWAGAAVPGLAVLEGSRRSELDRLRKTEPVTSSARMVRALRRVSDVPGLGLGGLDVSAISHRRWSRLDADREGMEAARSP